MSLERFWARFVLALLLFPTTDALGGPVVRIQDPDGDGIREIVMTPDPHKRLPRLKIRRKVDRLGNPLLAASDAETSDKVAWTAVAGTQAALQVIGLSLAWGQGPAAPNVPVKLEVCVRANPNDPCTTWQPTFADLSELAEFETDSVNLGSEQALLVFRATAAYPDFTAPTWQRAVLSNTANAIVLYNGDNINSVVFQRPNPPTQNPFGDQQEIPYFLDPYLEPDGTVVLDPNQWLMLFELGATNPASSAYDFQDLVILADLSGGVVQQGDIYLPTVADGLNADSMLNPKSSFVWAMVRSAPGNSRTRGVFYSRDLSFSAGNGSQEFYACIETTHGWLDCGLATSAQLQSPVYTRNFPSGSIESSALTVDMTVTNMQTHAIGWKERTDSDIYRYKVMFKTNGQPWGDGVGGTVPVSLGNYTETGAGETDIDIRSNDADKIGVLAYYGTVGSSEPDGARLVLYVYDTPSLSQTRVVVVPSGGGISLPETGCVSECFGLVGDEGNCFHVFFNAPGGGTTQDLKVVTVINGLNNLA